MLRAEGRDAFVKAPAGRFLAGRTWLHFCAHAELFGVVLFGKPDADDIAALVQSLVVELGAGVGPHASLVDASRLERVDPGAFEVLAAYVRDRRVDLGARVTRLALVRPAGIEGAVVAGFYPVSGAPYPVSLFEDAAAALAWLGSSASLADVLSSCVTEARGESALVGALRALLRARFADATVDEACRVLGVSERTLQRRLQDAGTTFQTELTGARMEEAQRRLDASDAPITTIALDVGYQSLQHFSAAFHKATGMAPSAWRKRQ